MKNLTFILLLSALSCFSQNKKLLQKLDSTTQFIETRLNIKPGTSIIITKENKTLYTDSYGLSSIELNTKNKVETLYDLASIAKMFTGYSIATLEVQGKISMQDDIRKYLKDFPAYNHTITIGHLVHHTSGIKNWTYLIGQMGWSSEDKISTDQLLRVIYAQKNLDFTPGERYRYSNSGYVLLTKIIEVVTGQSFVDWTDQNIFTPLKMDNTFFNDDQNKVILDMASAYSLNENREGIKKAYNTCALGSSSLISNTIDMAKWMNFLLYPPKEKEAIVQKMFTLRKLNDGSTNDYAYGVELSEFNGTKTIGHDGSWLSFTSYMKIIPDLKVGIFFANNFRVNTESIMNLYLEAFLPSKKPSPEEEQDTKKQDTENSSEEVHVSVKQLDRLTGVYKLGEAWFLDITRKGEKLYTKATGERTFYMEPVNDSTFIVSAYGGRKITFKFEDDKKAVALEYNGINAPKKTSPFYFNRKQFEKYEGVYYSTELDLLYRFKIKDDTLLYTNIKSGTQQLFFIRDHFFFSEGRLSKVEFQLNDKNQVLGFHIKNSRGQLLFYFNKANKSK